MAFPEGNKLFAGDFRSNLDETNGRLVIYPMSGNNATLKIDFTDLTEKMRYPRSLFDMLDRK